MRRRELLALVPGGLLAATVRRPHAACTTAPWPDLLEAVKAIKSLGYDGYEVPLPAVETQFPDAEQGRRNLHRGGLRVLGVVLEKPDLAPDTISRAADRAAAFGAERLILTGAAKAGILNSAGKICRGKGVRLAYRATSSVIQELVGPTDRSMVHFILEGAADPIEFWKSNHYRIDGLRLEPGSQQPDYAMLSTAMYQEEWTGWIIADTPDEARMPEAREAIRRVFGV